MNRHSGTLRAKWVVPVDSEPIRNGVVTVKEGVIVSVEGDVAAQPNENDLGDAVVLPGLINAHTHLEFSNLDQPLGHPGISFTDWIWLVVQHRISEQSQTDAANSKSIAIGQGLEESRQAGVIHVGEIATDPVLSSAYDSVEIPQATVFLELLGRDDLQLEAKLNIAKATLGELKNSNAEAGLSPHATYSVSPQLLDRVIQMAMAKHLPVAMHLAESKAELELLDKIEGPFVPLLQRLGAWFPESYRAGKRPLNYLQKLSRLPRVLVIHGNYLAPDELDFISDHKTRFSVVYCPRTHQFFGHDPYPLEQMLKLGINVALGTDSRASNPDLNLLNEMKSVKAAFPEISPQRIVEMATLGGATALGLRHQLGSLKPGKQALFSVASVSDVSVEDPYAAILNSNGVNVHSFCKSG